MIVKEVDLTIADVGQPITYTISLANLGNTTANNVIVTDIILMAPLSYQIVFL